MLRCGRDREKSSDVVVSNSTNNLVQSSSLSQVVSTQELLRTRRTVQQWPVATVEARRDGAKLKLTRSLLIIELTVSSVGVEHGAKLRRR